MEAFATLNYVDLEVYLEVVRTLRQITECSIVRIISSSKLVKFLAGCWVWMTALQFPPRMPLQEAVSVVVPVVTQPHLALPAEPRAVFATVTCLAVGTPSSLEPGRLLLPAHPHRKVPQRKSGDEGWPSTRSSTTAVVADHLTSQLQSKLLYVSVRAV